MSKTLRNWQCVTTLGRSIIVGNNYARLPRGGCALRALGWTRLPSGSGPGSSISVGFHTLFPLAWWPKWFFSFIPQWTGLTNYQALRRPDYDSIPPYSNMYPPSSPHCHSHPRSHHYPRSQSPGKLFLFEQAVFSKHREIMFLRVFSSHSRLSPGSLDSGTVRFCVNADIFTTLIVSTMCLGVRRCRQRWNADFTTYERESGDDRATILSHSALRVEITILMR